MDGDPRTGLGAVNATTGADMPWDVTNPIADDGTTASMTSLTADATQVYGSGYFYTSGGNFEGRFAVNPDTGTIIWMNSCHGDTYATFPDGSGAVQRQPRTRVHRNRRVLPERSSATARAASLRRGRDDVRNRNVAPGHLHVGLGSRVHELWW